MTPRTVAHQPPLCMEFPRQEHWTGLPFPPPGDLSDPETESTSPVTLALASGFFITVTPGKPREWVATSFSGDLLDPEIKPESPALAGGFFNSEPSGKPVEAFMAFQIL